MQMHWDSFGAIYCVVERYSGYYPREALCDAMRSEK